MKYIFSILLCLALQTGFSQIYKTVGISYTSGTPTYIPAKAGSWLALDTVTWNYYTYNGSTWILDGYRVQSISGCSAPNYTPTKYQSRLVINACTAGQGGPELYYYTGSAWLQVGGSSISEPSGQVLYGTGGGVDSDTGFLYQARKAYAPNFRLLPTRNDSTGIIWVGGNKMIHFYAPNNDSIPSDNIFIGLNTGNFTMQSASAKYQAKHNTIIGGGSGANISTGYLNTIIGWESAKNCTSCAGTIAIGGHVLENIVTHHDNVGVGDIVLQKLASGKENTGIAYSALANLLSGDWNFAGGYGAGSTLINGSSMTFLGKGTNIDASIAGTTVTNSTAVGADAIITKSNQVVLGSASVEEVVSRATFVAGKVGANLRMVGGGTDATDAGFFVGNTGSINFASWDGQRGFNIAATTGDISQLGTGKARFNNTGIGGVADATHKLYVYGSAYYTGTVNFGSVGANLRIKSSSGTTANDGFIGIGGGNNILFGNWDLNRGWDIKSTGIIEQIGNYALKLGTGAGFPTGAVGLVKHNTTTGSFQGVAVGTTPTDFVQSQSVNAFSNGTTSAPAASAQVDIVSTTKGVLFPRMTSAQRDAISGPATGLTLYCTDCTATDTSTGVMQTYNGATWKNNW